MSSDYFEGKLSIIMKEWDYCQTNIGRFDTLILGIRGWAVTAFTGVLAISVTKSIPFLMLFGIFPTLLFWIAESVDKSFQRIFIRRERVIEAYLTSLAFLEDYNRREISFISPILYHPPRP